MSRAQHSFARALARMARRAGLEDSLWDGPGTLARGNADQVARVRRLLRSMSLNIATPDEARTLLGSKGPENVGF